MTVAAPPTEAVSAPTFWRLLATELHRIAARRFTHVLLGLAVLGYLAAVIFLFVSHARPTAADLAAATAERDQAIAEIQASVERCLAEQGNDEMYCGFVPSPEEYPAELFLNVLPFQPESVAAYALAVGVGVAMAGFLLGATFIGAEWSSKNLLAWLFFEPRRLRLLGAKVLVLVGTTLVLSMVAQVIWHVTARVLLSTRGGSLDEFEGGSASFWSETLAGQARAALVVVPAALLGFGLANLIRNTAAALGIAFVYFLVVEGVVAALEPRLQAYQLTSAAAAWVVPGGITVYGNPVYDPEVGAVIREPIPLSNLHGGLVLLGYAVVVTAVSVWIFRRRDIT